jgi:hypothetical protein
MSWWNGACSNCVHDDAGATCTARVQDNRKLSYKNFVDEIDRRSRSPEQRKDRDGKGGQEGLGGTRRSGRITTA